MPKNPAQPHRHPLRRARLAAGEMAASSAVIGYLFATALSIDTARPSDLLARASAVGGPLTGQIGWMLGVYLPLLLGFYAVVIGGQIIVASSETRIQRVLGLVAEGITVATTVATIFITVYCLTTPGKWGILIAVLPAVGVLWFLASQLGTFVVLDGQERADAARRTIEWSVARETKLGRLSRRSPLFVWAAWTLALSCGACVAWRFTISPTLGALLLLTALCATLVGLTLAINLISIRISLATGVLNAAGTYLVSVFIYGAYAVTAITVCRMPASTLAIREATWTMTAAIAAGMLVSFWPRSWCRPWMVNWTILGVAARGARVRLERRRRWAQSELDLIDELTVRPSIRNRAVEAAQVLLGRQRA